MKSTLSTYSDGASRGNPGPSAVAFIIIGEGGRILKEGSKYLGVRTNNQAEYQALLLTLESASKLTEKKVVCHMDSKLVVKQLTGEYLVRDAELKVLWLQVHELAQKFENVAFVKVPRTDYYIKKVDQIANEALDRLFVR